MTKATSCAVSVKFLGFLQRLTDEREASVTVEEGATVADLLATLAGRYGPEFASAVFSAPREVHTHLRVFLNEQEAAMTDRLARDGGAPAAVAVLIVPGFEGGSR